MFRPCEYEFLPPSTAVREAATADGEDVRWTHPDASVTVRAMTLSRSAWARRFVFFEALHANEPRNDPPAVFPLYQGFRNAADGSVVILKGGQPYGYYTSIASAWRRLTRPSGLFLAWLEPDTAMPDTALTASEYEASRGPASGWYFTLPFTAHGPAEARQRCLDVTLQLQGCLPGLDRLDTTYRHGGDLDTETHVFCECPGCLHPPGHAGDHQPPAVPATPDTDSEDDWP